MQTAAINAWAAATSMAAMLHLPNALFCPGRDAPIDKSGRHLSANPSLL
jgi:hypothetical protein